MDSSCAKQGNKLKVMNSCNIWEKEKKKNMSTLRTNCCKLPAHGWKNQSPHRSLYSSPYFQPSPWCGSSNRRVVGSGLGSSGGRITGPRPSDPAAAAHPYAYVENRAALQQHFAGQLLPGIHTFSSISMDLLKTPGRFAIPCYSQSIGRQQDSSKSLKGLMTKPRLGSIHHGST